MKYSFGELGNNIFSRNFGGTQIGVADPFVTGHFFMWFDQLPPDLHTYTSEGPSGLNNADDIRKVLAASCLSVTPPGGTLNNIDFTGLGGTKWGVPGNIDYGNTLSAKFLEFNGTPILDIFHYWVKMIRDYRTGASLLTENAEGEGYTKKTYAGLCYFFTTAPDGHHVENFACFDGVYPMKDPQDLFSGDVETEGKLEIEIEFHIDYMWREPWVRTRCQSLADTFAASRDEIRTRNLSGSGT
jgi:hypothetical protein